MEFTGAGQTVEQLLWQNIWCREYRDITGCSDEEALDTMDDLYPGGLPTGMDPKEKARQDFTTMYEHGVRYGCDSSRQAV